MIPTLKTVIVEVLGQQLVVSEMNGAAFAAMVDARSDAPKGKSESAKAGQIKVAAAVAKHVVEGWSDESVDTIMRCHSVQTLTTIMETALTLSGFDDDEDAAAKNSEAGPEDASSSSSLSRSA